jgi:cell wall-associated NlpC family hydrolase
MALRASRLAIVACLSAVLAVVLFAAPASAHHDDWSDGDAPCGQVDPQGTDSPSDDSSCSWEDDGSDDDWSPDPADDPGDEGADGTAPAPVPASELVPLPRTPRAPHLPPAPVLPEVPIPTTATIPGTRALVRADGKAAIPRGAPKRIRTVIAAINQIVGRPYKWGGGHARLIDRGYDCSGAVGYGLIGAGLLAGPMVSGQLAHWESSGPGRWMTVYATRSHVYMEVAGLRLDTSPVADPTPRSGVRWRPAIGRRPGFHARHPVGL